MHRHRNSSLLWCSAMKIPLTLLREAAPSRPIGYFEDVVSRGIITDELIDLPDSSYAELLEKYRAYREPPNYLEQGFSITLALGRWAIAGFPVVDEATLFARSCECALCPAWDARAGRCLDCGCKSLKHWLATERCPRGKWKK